MQAIKVKWPLGSDYDEIVSLFLIFFFLEDFLRYA